MRDGLSTVGKAGPSALGKACVFLDRDDTLIANAAIADRMAHPGYLYQPELVELLPGVAEGLRRMRAAGYALVVVTNQSAAARGWCRVEEIEATNERMRELLRREGVELDGVYTCLYSPEGCVEPWNRDDAWRKPRPGMLIQAAEDLGLDLGRSWMIGDAERDVEAGLAAGIAEERTVMVGSGVCGRVGRRCVGIAEAGAWLMGSRGEGM